MEVARVLRVVGGGVVCCSSVLVIHGEDSPDMSSLLLEIS